MNLSKARITAIAVGIAAVVGISLSTAVPAIADSPNTIDGTSVSVPGVHTKADLDKFILSASPKTLTVDISTGAVLSVAPQKVTATPQISYRNVCQTGDSYWHTSVIPLANACFYGTAGTYNGSWAQRDAFYSGSHTATGSWIAGGKTVHGPTIGPNSVFGLNSGSEPSTATANSATIF